MSAKKTKKGNKTAAAQAQIEQVGQVSNESVIKGSGKSWDFWLEHLDQIGGRELTHKELVAYLKKKFRLRPWWQQGVTSGYEVLIGRKMPGRNSKGEFSTVATKAIAAEAKSIWNLMTSDQGQTLWLNLLEPIKFHVGQSFETEQGVFGEVRTLKSPNRLRMTWQETDWAKPSVVQLMIISRKNKKTMVAIQHEKLMDARLKLKMREFWKSGLSKVHDQFLQSK